MAPTLGATFVTGWKLEALKGKGPGTDLAEYKNVPRTRAPRVLGEAPAVLPCAVGPTGQGAHPPVHSHGVTHQRLCRKVIWLSPSVSAARVGPPSRKLLRLEERRPEEDLASLGLGPRCRPRSVPSRCLRTRCLATPRDRQDGYLHPRSVKYCTKLRRGIQMLILCTEY